MKKISHQINYALTALFLVFTLSLSAQQLKGVVEDIYSQPLSGVYIYNLNSEAHAHTLDNGAFVIENTKPEDTLSVSLLGFKKLITAEVSLNNIGGPIAIGKVASDSFHISLSMFFRLMAIISINLGIINLFPITVLDGGYIVFIGLEILNRGPLSRKKLQIAQQFGMSLLFLLIFVALFNDISRFF